MRVTEFWSNKIYARMHYHKMVGRVDYNMIKWSTITQFGSIFPEPFFQWNPIECYSIFFTPFCARMLSIYPKHILSKLKSLRIKFGYMNSWQGEKDKSWNAKRRAQENVPLYLKCDKNSLWNSSAFPFKSTFFSDEYVNLVKYAYNLTGCRPMNQVNWFAINLFTFRSLSTSLFPM